VRRLRLRGWSLRARLVVILVALLAAVCLTVGALTQITLHSYLLSRVDKQLAAAGLRSMNPPPDGGDGQRHDPNADFDPARALSGPGQAVGTLSVLIRDGTVTKASVVANTSARAQARGVAPSTLTALDAIGADGHANTVTLGDDLGEYRVQAQRLDNGDIMVTGLPLFDLNETLTRVAVAEVAVSGGALVVAGLAGMLIIRRTLRPLRRVAATASRVAELPLSRGEVALPVRVAEADTDPRTEVGQVGSAINRMLGHVASALEARHASETRVRHFVADASHELRTPLAAIRGYAELARRGRDEVPPDIAHALRRVESESARMTALVEDLLLLARLDSGRPLDAAPVDLSRLVADVVSDAHVAGPDHHHRLALPAEPVLVTGDEQRLHQVLANLLTNARTHTPPGTTVTTAVTTGPGAAVLTVADDGPGIPAGLLPEVFERFARGDTSRSRAAGSTGLGLAIVAAVVAAHHGTVHVESRPGRTVFTVRLPLAAEQH
jgi:two-component system OmpR family sensor kinase